MLSLTLLFVLMMFFLSSVPSIDINYSHGEERPGLYASRACVSLFYLH